LNYITLHVCDIRQPAKKRRTVTTEDVDAEILRQLTDKNEDEDSLFGQSVAASLRKLDPQKKSLAKIRIQQTLYEIEFTMPVPVPQLPPPVSSEPTTSDFDTNHLPYPAAGLEFTM
jgi:hypothetical protein